MTPGRAGAPDVPGSWTTPEMIKEKVARHWRSGVLPRMVAGGADEPFAGYDFAVRSPRASEIGEQLAAVREWIARLEQGSRSGRRYEIEYAEIGGRVYGRNRIPKRIKINSMAQVGDLLGVNGQIDVIRDLVRRSPVAAIRDWVMRNPLAAWEIDEEWSQLLAAYDWLVAARGSGVYLRQITAPGVDTKFVERHRRALAQMLEVRAEAGAFVRDLGLRLPPGLVRLRAASGVLGLPDGLGEATLRVDEAADLVRAVDTAVIIENEVTFLSVPIPVGGVVIWGRGFDVDQAGRLPWLKESRIHYWGDLDTHGFAILNRLRAWQPHAESFLMDRATLLRHRDRWVHEPKPARSVLERLTSAESNLYAELVTDHHAEQVRLEQERIDWVWATSHLPYRRPPG